MQNKLGFGTIQFLLTAINIAYLPEFGGPLAGFILGPALVPHGFLTFDLVYI